MGTAAPEYPDPSEYPETADYIYQEATEEATEPPAPYIRSEISTRFPPRIPADPTTVDLLSDYHDEMDERTVEVSVNDDKIIMIINTEDERSITPETTIIETTTLSQPAIEVEAVTEIPVEASLETVTQISIEEWKRLKSLEVETSTEPFIKIALKCSPVKCLPLNPASNRALSPV